MMTKLQNTLDTSLSPMQWTKEISAVSRQDTDTTSLVTRVTMHEKEIAGLKLQLGTTKAELSKSAETLITKVSELRVVSEERDEYGERAASLTAENNRLKTDLEKSNRALTTIGNERQGFLATVRAQLATSQEALGIKTAEVTALTASLTTLREETKAEADRLHGELETASTKADITNAELLEARTSLNTATTMLLDVQQQAYDMRRGRDDEYARAERLAADVARLEIAATEVPTPLPCLPQVASLKRKSAEQEHAASPEPLHLTSAQKAWYDAVMPVFEALRRLVPDQSVDDDGRRLITVRAVESFMTNTTDQTMSNLAASGLLNRWYCLVEVWVMDDASFLQPLPRSGQCDNCKNVFGVCVQLSWLERGVPANVRVMKF